MDFSHNEVNPFKRYGGLIAVTLLHVAVAYALIHGLSHKTIDLIRQPVEVKVLDEIKPPPDKPPPPPPIPQAKPPAAPLPFIPPPDAPAPQQTPNPVTATPTPPPEAQPFQKTNDAPPAARAEPAPSSPAFADLEACKPEYPQKSREAGEEGTVTVQFEIGADAQLIGAKVTQSSGFPRLDKTTLNALSRCKFKAAYKDGKPVQWSLKKQWVWKLED